MSIDDLARQCKITGGYLGRLERCEDGHKNPRIETLITIASVLKVGVSDLLPTLDSEVINKSYDQNKIETKPPVQNMLSKDETEILEIWRNCDSEKKRAIKNLMKTMQTPIDMLKKKSKSA